MIHWPWSKLLTSLWHSEGKWSILRQRVNPFNVWYVPNTTYVQNKLDLNVLDIPHLRIRYAYLWGSFHHLSPMNLPREPGRLFEHSYLFVFELSWNRKGQQIMLIWESSACVYSWMARWRGCLMCLTHLQQGNCSREYCTLERQTGLSVLLSLKGHSLIPVANRWLCTWQRSFKVPCTFGTFVYPFWYGSFGTCVNARVLRHTALVSPKWMTWNVMNVIKLTTQRSRLFTEKRIVDCYSSNNCLWKCHIQVCMRVVNC